MINREFYHKMFRQSLADILQPIYYEIVMADYAILQKSVNDEHVLPIFKEFLLKKIEEVKERKNFDFFTMISKKIKNIDKFADLCQAININFIKMNTLPNFVAPNEVTQSDLYAITLIEVYSTLNINSYLFMPVNNLYDHERRKSMIFNKIRCAIIRGIDRAMNFNLIPDDKVQLINNIRINVGDKMLMIDKERLLQIFGGDSSLPFSQTVQQPIQQPETTTTATAATAHGSASARSV